MPVALPLLLFASSAAMSEAFLEMLDVLLEISAELLAMSAVFWSICSSRVFTSFTQSAERVSPSCAVSSSEVMTVWARVMRVRVVSMAAICRVNVFTSVLFVSVRGG